MEVGLNWEDALVGKIIRSNGETWGGFQGPGRWQLSTDGNSSLIGLQVKRTTQNHSPEVECRRSSQCLIGSCDGDCLGKKDLEAQCLSDYSVQLSLVELNCLSVLGIQVKGVLPTVTAGGNNVVGTVICPHVLPVQRSSVGFHASGRRRHCGCGNSHGTVSNGEAQGTASRDLRRHNLQYKVVPLTTWDVIRESRTWNLQFRREGSVESRGNKTDATRVSKSKKSLWKHNTGVGLGLQGIKMGTAGKSKLDHSRTFCYSSEDNIRRRGATWHTWWKRNIRVRVQWWPCNHVFNNLPVRPAILAWKALCLAASQVLNASSRVK